MKVRLPKYRDERWVRTGLPTRAEPWVAGGQRSLGAGARKEGALAAALERAGPLKGPRRAVFFVADPHADADAFVDSLVASGGVEREGPGATDFRLTQAGQRGVFVIGGDCLDKGPSNLRMLRSLRALLQRAPRVKVLAGNHDVRTLLGLAALQRPDDPHAGHYFARLGPKVVPLLAEVRAAAPEGRSWLDGIPGEKACKRRLSVPESWFDTFPRRARGVLGEPAIERELTRMRAKLPKFQQRCARAGLSMRAAYASALACHALLVHPDGAYAWFFRSLRLAWRQGSFLFIHAGADDVLAAELAERSVRAVNRRFAKQLWEDPFALYHGPLANAIRTKYRAVDMPFTRRGAELLHGRGVHVIVHGHRNHTTGQRLALRRGLLHVEADVTLDRNVRAREGLDGHGAGATIVRPSGLILGISTDHKRAKVLDPRATRRSTPEG